MCESATVYTLHVTYIQCACTCNYIPHVHVHEYLTCNLPYHISGLQPSHHSLEIGNNFSGVKVRYISGIPRSNTITPIH